MKSKLCVGLFGTCGTSTWRDAFIEDYERVGIDYFNPNITDREWVPEDAVAEADHLAEDRVILFPITGETYGTGSLAESGFSILQAIRLDDRRQFVIMIDQKLNKQLMDENPVAAKESTRARALVRKHLEKQNLSNLHVVDNLKDMLKVSKLLYTAEEFLLQAKGI